jgi:hypothetical protein
MHVLTSTRAAVLALALAAAPAESAEFRIALVLQIGAGGGCESAAMPEDAGRVGIVVQGGRAAAERAASNWLLTRSIARSDVSAETGPVSPRQALGIQAQPPRWVLRY